MSSFVVIATAFLVVAQANSSMTIAEYAQSACSTEFFAVHSEVQSLGSSRMNVWENSASRALDPEAKPDAYARAARVASMYGVLDLGQLTFLSGPVDNPERALSYVRWFHAAVGLFDCLELTSEHRQSLSAEAGELLDDPDGEIGCRLNFGRSLKTALNDRASAESEMAVVQNLYRVEYAGCVEALE